MTPDPSIFTKKIRHLSQALMISGALNIGILSLWIYWVLKEQSPTAYCELKPASIEQQQMPLVDQREWSEVLTHLSQLSFLQLVNYLSHTQLIENGYTERDLALACLVALHHFDIHRALPKDAQPQQERLLMWKSKPQLTSIPLIVYPNLTQSQFDAIIRFAKTEQWPLTPEGLFLLLQKQKKENQIEPTLIETFMLSTEFWTVELLFNRFDQRTDKTIILSALLEGNWNILKQFVDQQRQLQDSSDARRQKFLLDYLKIGAPSAAILLLKTEWDFAVIKLDDYQVISILQLVPHTFTEGAQFAKEMLISPRSTNVWKYATSWLYKQADEPMPKEWNYQAVLSRFSPEKLKSATPFLPSKSPPPLPILKSQEVVMTPLKTTPLKTPTIVQTKLKNSSKMTQSTMEEKKTVVASSLSKQTIYVVQEGDTLWKIAQRFKVKVEVLKAQNELRSDTIKKGMVLKMP